MHIDAGQLGKYELRERLGQGGMAEVWKAFDSRLQRFVAIKFLHSILRSDPTFISRFLREAQAVASLHHPNIVQIYDFETPEPGNGNAQAYMVMDYIEGQTLSDFLDTTSHAGKFLLETDLLSLFYSISDAIDYAHRRGLLHRDIKPANILLDQRNTARNSMGEPILTDFGIVKIIGSAPGTLTNSAMGTPLYISPEQALGHPDTAASDIYSLGVVLYEVCTGRPPFLGDSPFAILQQHITTPPPAPEQFNPAISSDLSAVILHSLAKRPEERYPSAMALMAALAVALNLTLPDHRGVSISSPDIRMLPGSDPEEDESTQLLGEPVSATPAIAKPISPAPEAFLATPVNEMPTVLPTILSGEQVKPLPAAAAETPQVSQWVPSTYTPIPQQAQPEPPRSANRRRTWIIALSVLLIIVLVGSGLTAFQIYRAHSSTPTAAATVVGQAFFTSTGNGNGANNLGLNDAFQANLTHLQAPTAGKQYYAWLLPDVAQPENNNRALGVLHVSGGAAMISYTDPQHANLIGLFSRFLVTEEAINPAPISPSLDQAAWRYYAEIPQGTLIKDCAGVTITQLSVLCHLRHLLSGDPDLAKVNLQGGLNYWLLNNVKEMVKWAQESVDHNNAVDVRHKLVNLLYTMDGPVCIQQSLQKAAPGTDNVVDDSTLPTIAAIPLLNCSQTPNLPGYVAHIDNHLNALLQSPGVLSNQKSLAHQINPELNTIGAWLNEVHSDVLQLIAMNDVQLAQTNGHNLRNAMSTLVAEVLSGGVDATTGTQDQGVQTIASQIQALAKMDVTLYQAH